MKKFKYFLKRYSIKILPALNSYCRFSILFLILLIFIGVYETVSDVNSHVEKLPLTTIAGSIFINYIFYWLKTFLFILIPYVIIHICYKPLANFFYIFFATALLLLQVALIQYFNKSMVPLGADLFAYSIADIKQTLGASGGVGLLQIIAFIILIAFALFVFIFFSKKIIVNKYLALAMTFFSVFVLITGFSFPNLGSLKTEYARTLVLNKSDFFIAQSYHYFSPEIVETDIYSDSYSGDFGNDMPAIKDFVYVDEGRFPFLHKDETPDVLSPFFNQSNQKPNIVIILVEGLGRAFTNEGAVLGNFTPFLDSLSKRSLYWNNFLSSAGRSFAVLPSVLGSLPFGKNGFNEMGENMPKHLSLINIARHDGYKTAFFYGGDSKFDNMDLFLKKSGINNIYDENTFPAGFTKLPSENGFTWGYGDQELFRRYLQIQPETDIQPKLNVLFTVATHSPFLLNNQERYNQLFERRMNELNFSTEKKNAYQRYQAQYASILFFDQALRTFINNYKERSDFKNTIFIITGDHRMPEIPMLTKMDRYHVPLIIYSPLLKRTASFSSISSHFDIAPSLLAFLKNSYSLEKPTLASWIGSGLDTSRPFSNSHQYPLMQTKNEVVDFVQGAAHLNGKTAYSISSDMNEEETNEKGKSDQLIDGFNRFKIRNESFMKGGPLTPDSIYQKYFSR
jgi:phosphoglycerol transferase MdoB-like AlkP superfamily enzyme